MTTTRTRTRTKPKPPASPALHPVVEELALGALDPGVRERLAKPLAAGVEWRPWPEFDACRVVARPWAEAIAAHVAANGGPRLAVPEPDPEPAAAPEPPEPADAPDDPALDKAMSAFNEAHDAQDAAESEGGK